MPHVPPQFGSYRIVRPLGESAVGERLLAIDDRTDHAAVVHVRPSTLTGKRRHAELAVLQGAASARGPHLLPILGWGFWPGVGGRLAWVTPYTGSAPGLISLRDHVRTKGGTLGPREAGTVVQHLWAGAKAAHASGHVQGVVDPSSVLIDQHGQAWFENYGLARLLLAPADDAAMARKLELLSIAALGVELTTGLAPPLPRTIPDLPVMPEIPDAWRERAKALSEEAIAASIATALQAHDSLPAILGALRDMVGDVRDAQTRASQAAANAASDAVKHSAKAAMRAVASSVWDLIRGR